MSLRAPNLLLVDDDATTLRALSRVLSAYPNQRLATSGMQALHLARAEPPDLMLIDMQMPGMSGTQLCALLKSEPGLADVPVLFVTSDDTEETRLEALQLGAADFIIKPFMPEQLQLRVAAILRNAAQLEQAKEEAARNAPTTEVLHTGPRRLMVADDDANAIALLRHILRGMGEVRVVRQGEEAMQLAKSWRPDLVLIDALMPGMDGFELCRRLQSEAGLRHVPIVFVTRLANFQYEAMALELGATEFIVKPYSPAILKARVSNLLELKRHMDVELATAASQGQRLTAERLGAVVESASDAIVTVDNAHRVVLMNAAAGRLFQVDHLSAPGTEAELLLGRRLPGLDLFAPTPPRRVIVIRDSGDALPAEVSVSEAGEKALRLTTLMFRDLSDRERLESESSARAAAEATNRAKALMITHVAHEISAPLHCILGFARQLRQDNAAPLSDTQALRLQMIETCSVQLSSLVKDLTTLESFDLGKLTVDNRPVDSRRVVNDAMQAASVLAEQVEVTLSQDLSLAGSKLVLADAGRLMQCLISLLSLGIQRSPSHGQVTAVVRPVEDHVEISVTDQGPTLTPRQIAQLNDPLQRSDVPHLPAVEAGLQLILTRKLIEAMGGHLEVRSPAGAGCQVCVVLRQVPALAHAASTVRPDPPATPTNG